MHSSEDYGEGRAGQGRGGRNGARRREEKGGQILGEAGDLCLCRGSGEWGWDPGKTKLLINNI